CAPPRAVGGQGAARAGLRGDDDARRSARRGNSVDSAADRSRARLMAPLSLIVPVYNEADNFPRLLAEIEKHIPRPFTMVVVYDFAADTTVPVARAMAAERPWLRLLKNDLGRGVVYAIKAGFAAVDAGPALVVMADLSDDLAIVPRMLDLYAQGNRVVC